jgi:hypothetical protein
VNGARRRGGETMSCVTAITVSIALVPYCQSDK